MITCGSGLTDFPTPYNVAVKINSISSNEISQISTGKSKLLSRDLDLSAYRVEVIVPEGVSVSTAEAYGGLGRNGFYPPERLSVREGIFRPVSEWKDLIVNDFEPSVFASHPALADLKQDLYNRGALYAAMSGSGSALYGIFAS